METTLIILAFLFGFYMLWNMGANDVANAMGTSVGSKALTLKKALIVASVLEFSGAFLMGSNVSSTIQHGIVHPSDFSDPYVFVWGMLASLLSTSLWVQLATIFKWPVSTTHSIIGSILGFGIVVAGFYAVDWVVVGKISLSWVISPLVSAFVAYVFFAIVQKKILFSYSPLAAAKKLSPLLVFLVLATFVVSLTANGIRNFHLYISPYIVVSSAVGVGLIGALITYFLCKSIVLQGNMSLKTATYNEQQIYSLQKAEKHLTRAKLFADQSLTDKITSMLNSVKDLLSNIAAKTRWDDHLSEDYKGVERIFGYLQLISACFVAFAHGANDVANATGPISAILQIVLHPDQFGTSTHIPLWLLAFGGISIVIGLASFGWRVIETIGQKITHLTPTRGFCAEFAAATTILVASKIGLPISTTHAIVGAVFGVGLARGLSSLNIRLMHEIFLSWAITIPSSAITSIIFFYILKFFFTF